MTSSSTPSARDALSAAVGGIPDDFRNRIIDSYLSVRLAFAESTFDAVGLRVGHFAEAVLRLLQQRFLGRHTAFGKRLPNFALECAEIEKAPASDGDEPLRVIMPRALSFVYTLRNKRGIGHLGDVDANAIDAATCARTADWCLCELIRSYRASSLEEAQALLDAISVRQVPEIWRIGTKARVLTTGLSRSQETLLLLYSQEEPVAVEDLASWIEHPSVSDYRKDVLRRLHRERLIELDEDTQTAVLSPKGATFVEQVLRPGIQKGIG